MRCFIAVPIPDGVKKSIFNYLNRIKGTQSGIRWVKEKNIHITLRFLGETKEDIIDEIEEIIKNASKGCASFNIELVGTGYFPSARRAKVIWIGIEDGKEELLKIFEELECRIVNLGFKKERPFHPHLTIGRVKGPRPLNLPDFEKHLFTAKEITLYKSTLTPSGPIYEPLIRSPLS